VQPAEASSVRAVNTLDALTAQELQIAQLASVGLFQPGDRRATLPVHPDHRFAPVPIFPKLA